MLRRGARRPSQSPWFTTYVKAVSYLLSKGGMDIIIAYVGACLVSLEQGPREGAVLVLNTD